MIASRSVLSRSPRGAMATLGLAFILVLGACGSGDGAETDGLAVGEAVDGETTADGGAGSGDGSDEAAEEAAEPEETAGDSSGTATMADGTVYVFASFPTCTTEATDPSGFPIVNGYDIIGRTADEMVEISLIRAGIDDETAVFSGALEAAGGQGSLLYIVVNDTADLTVDGPKVTGTVDVNGFGPEKPHGDKSEMTIDITC